MNPVKIERVIHYEGGLERRSSIECDKDRNPMKPEGMSEESEKEWDKILKWFENRKLSHLIDGITLRDHCLSVCRGERGSCNLDKS